MAIFLKTVCAIAILVMLTHLSRSIDKYIYDEAYGNVFFEVFWPMATCYPVKGTFGICLET